MKKKFLTGSLLPVLAGAAVIGSGFSLWFFSDTKVENPHQNLSANVTQLVAVGTIQEADDFTIVFDQTEDGREKNAGQANQDIKSEAKGIQVVFGNDATTKKAVYTSPDNGIDQLENEVYFQFTTTITIDGDLSDYIDVTYDSNTPSIAQSTGGFVFILDKNVKEFDWEKVEITYKKDKEPANKDAYKTFADVVEKSKITVKYEVKVLGEPNNPNA